MQALNRKTTGIPATLPLKVLQFGGGNFLRAFVDWMVQVLNTETDFNGGVAVIKPTERGDYSDLKSQDGLFHVLLDGIRDGAMVSEKCLVTSVQKIIHAYTEWDAYLALAKNPGIRFVVSNTTEAGIRFNSEDAFEDAPPKEFPAKLTLWLYQRFEYFQGDYSKGCVLLPCELIENNGKALQEVVLKYIDHWNLNDDFKNWVASANHFCSTLVDRIVSGYPVDRAAMVQKELDYEDKLLVAGEWYHSWVIEAPEIVSEELPFAKTNLNVTFVNDLAPFREMKVRILNGAHTSMVPVGYLGGMRLVSETIEDEAVGGFIQDLLMEEVLPTLDFPQQVKQKFVNDVLDRFRNPSIKHRLISISLNSSSKFVTRLLPTMKDYYTSKGILPKRIVFSLACLIRFYKGEFNTEEIPLKDDIRVLGFFQDEWKKFDDNKFNINNLTNSVLSNTLIWGEDLTKFEWLQELVNKYLMEIESEGILEALKKI